MKEQDKYDSHDSGDVTRCNSWDDPSFEMLLSPVDSALFGKISDFMTGLSDIDDVKGDPGYSVTSDEVKVMISDYRENAVHNKENEKFILNSLNTETPERKLRNEISQIKEEINKSNLNDISSEWVKEWHEKSQRNGSKDAKTEEIRNFITGSLRQDDIKTEPKSGEKKLKGLSISLIAKYTSLAAAAVIAVLLLIRPLIPSGDPQKIFSKYYEPFNAASSITRGTGADKSEIFANAIADYKSGKYQAAASGFTIAMFNGQESNNVAFYLGVTEIELGNFDRAIKLLSGVVNQKNAYSKEANWYLGLAYIKSGNPIKASECFELLARSPGYYSDRSEKILRLLR
jgi:tetratricopeptide (TPR) repeat protein